MRAFLNAALAGAVLLTCGQVGAGDAPASPAAVSLPPVAKVLDSRFLRPKE